MTIDCIVEKDETGTYCASVPALPGCFTDGRTLAQLKHNLADAIALYLEDMVADQFARI